MAASVPNSEEFDPIIISVHRVVKHMFETFLRVFDHFAKTRNYKWASTWYEAKNSATFSFCTYQNLQSSWQVAIFNLRKEQNFIPNAVSLQSIP